ncbi:hypothetical protein ACTVZO_22125 [Streptomyces sp. IBSNAI002]|uniref:hypothetical protein n=1 Tax=Streptomyces sp. IBSNAI002 TaxID=3457500 RepID=UPI003FD55EC6
MAAVPQDLLDRVRDLERRVRELAGRAQMRPALTEIMHGDVRIGEGGRLITQAPGGNVVFESGQAPQGDWGVKLAREDGSNALTVGYDYSTTSQMIHIWSRDTAAKNRILVMDDFYSDRFLGRPWIPLQLHPTERQDTGQTGYEVAWWGGGPAFNAVGELHLVTYAGAGGGQVKVTMEPASGPRVIAEYDCPAGQWTERTITEPMHGVEYMEHVMWTVEHRCKGSGSNIETRLYSATGRNTYVESEKPSDPVRTP